MVKSRLLDTLEVKDNLDDRLLETLRRSRDDLPGLGKYLSCRFNILDMFAYTARSTRTAREKRTHPCLWRDGIEMSTTKNDRGNLEGSSRIWYLVGR